MSGTLWFKLGNHVVGLLVEDGQINVRHLASISNLDHKRLMIDGRLLDVDDNGVTRNLPRLLKELQTSNPGRGTRTSPLVLSGALSGGPVSTRNVSPRHLLSEEVTNELVAAVRMQLGTMRQNMQSDLRQLVRDVDAKLADFKAELRNGHTKAH